MASVVMKIDLEALLKVFAIRIFLSFEDLFEYSQPSAKMNTLCVATGIRINKEMYVV